MNFYYLKIIHILHSSCYSVIIGRILKKKQQNTFVCIHEIMRLIVMKMKLKMTNRSHRYDIERTWSSLYDDIYMY